MFGQKFSEFSCILVLLFFTPSFGAAVSGGGAVVIPVFRNASAWIVG